ncbi:MAG: 23S rRNA (adenine2503-C2)-methyltransferase [Candidatus Tokpelaia sp. JSC161]|jgi:23S rRNA (adenine2503-C2)-methyltransferase|nr:MAG: 23S rRNA (adenine2503-C2)-methyltransferase [Candidatus Tokpelaia sp. JSC161]
MKTSFLSHHKTSIIGLTRSELASALQLIAIPQDEIPMRIKQLWYWLYVRGVSSFEKMSNISKTLRKTLEEHFSIPRPQILKEHISYDGTQKWLLHFPNHSGEVETVYIPGNERGTLCLSSQVGCSLSCSFCYTGTQRLVRNLTAEEILLQILIARDCLKDYTDNRLTQKKRKISNIVMMGMGEPLYNFEAVKKALIIASDSNGLSLSKRRITLSTSGVVPNISRVGTEIGVMLAISLHAVHDDLRNILVPINKKHSLAELINSCRNYPGLSNAKRITFEYVMLKDINDTTADAYKLIGLLRGIPAKINLIPFNPWPGSKYQCSDWQQIKLFANIINRAGYPSPIRTPRGHDILAACGQLKSPSILLKKSNSI